MTAAQGWVDDMGDSAIFNRGKLTHCLRAVWRRSCAPLCQLFEDDSGQGTVEYILLLSAIVVGAGFLSRKLLDVLDHGILTFGGTLEKDLKTGRAPLSVWSN